MSLPSSRHLLSALIASFPPADPAPSVSVSVSDSDSDSAAAATRRHLLSTLHVLFPAHLLPALDLLDRRLVVRLALPSSSLPAADASPTFLVLSSATPTPGAARRKRSSAAAAATAATAAAAENPPAPAPAPANVVSLAAWNCSCAAFTYDLFSATATAAAAAAATDQAEDGGVAQTQDNTEALFGGRARESAPPCCKHILACLLAEKCGLGEDVVAKQVTREQLAGLIAEA